MTTTKNKDAEKAIGQAPTALHKMNHDSKQKEEAKRWKPIDGQITLKESLERLAKSDLDTIRKQLDIKNVSSLKKAALIEVLEEQISANMERFCKLLDKERYSLLRNVAKKGGYAVAPDFESKQFIFFQDCGILFTGTFNDEKVVVMPKELVEKLSALDEKNLQAMIDRNTEWIKLTQGALYYYGSLTQSQLIQIVEKYMKNPIDVLEYLSVIEQAIHYYSEIRIDKKNIFSNIRVFDPERVLSEQKQRSELSYFPFTKLQLMNAGEPGFVDRNESYRRFVQFLLSRYEMSMEEADMIVEECVYAKRIGEQPKNILEYLQGRVEIASIESLRDIMDCIVDLMNNTRDWFLKGYTPEELNPRSQSQSKPLPSKESKIIDFHAKKKQKIGRNDPCPCGSNKKYKKCCGK